MPPLRASMALLTLHPVQTSALPLLHIGTKAPNGTVMVYDRASGRRFVVYSPRFIHEFRTGHRAGFWYFRSATTVEGDPQSQGYMSARAAFDALRLGEWGPPAAITGQSRELARRTGLQAHLAESDRVRRSAIAIAQPLLPGAVACDPEKASSLRRLPRAPMAEATHPATANAADRDGVSTELTAVFHRSA